MIRRIARTALCLLGPSIVCAQEVVPRVAPPARGPLVIRPGTLMKPGSYVRPDPAERGILVLEGLSGVVLDLAGVELRSGDRPRPNRAEGIGIVVRDCRDVTVRGGRVVGYAVGLWAERTTGLVVDGLAVEVTLMEPLHSTVTTESDQDRLVRELDQDGAFARSFGAALRLDDCSDWTVRNVRARRGQNGLLVSRGARGRAYDNDLSFLSGWGVALVDARSVTISRNRLDFCVRGYSAGHYQSGQGSAAFVLEGGCEDIVLAENSAVRAGTGAILSGLSFDALRAQLYEDALIGVGLEAEDASSQGRAEDEERGRLEVRYAQPTDELDVERAPAPRARDARVWIYGNDFTGAVRGGIVMADQADVWILGNSLEECGRAGIRGQRLYGVVIGDNTVQGADGSALALEDVQDCLIVRNVLHASEVGLQVWSSVEDEGEAARAPAPRSRDVWVTDNSFAENDVDLGIRGTRGLRFGANIWDPSGAAIATLDIEAADGVPAGVLANRDPETGEERPDLLRLETWLAGVGDWMPSGHVTSSSVWHPDAAAHPAYASFLAFEGLAVPGTPKQRLVRRSDEIGPLALGRFGPWDFESDDERPWLRLPGGALLGNDWRASWFRWSEDTDPRGALARWRELSEFPLYEETVPGWPTPYGPGETAQRVVAEEYFGLTARCEADLKPGRYRLTISSDDGVRMIVDGETVLENWSWHPMTRDTVELDLGGEHVFELEYFQIRGPAVLTVDLEPVR